MAKKNVKKYVSHRWCTVITQHDALSLLYSNNVKYENVKHNNNNMQDRLCMRGYAGASGLKIGFSSRTCLNCLHGAPFWYSWCAAHGDFSLLRSYRARQFIILLSLFFVVVRDHGPTTVRINYAAIAAYASATVRFPTNKAHITSRLRCVQFQQ